MRVVVISQIMVVAFLVACSGDDAPGPTNTCPGYTPPGAGATACRAAGDCAAIGSCYAPGSSCCPVGMIAPRDCESDVECTGTDVCEEFPATGACTSGLASECRTHCEESLRECPDGACDTSTGRCEPFVCPDEHTCPTNFDCDPTSGAADVNGCVVRACASDGECDCGACVNGFCVDGPGTCQPDCACASPDTPVATPYGERAIAELSIGDLVYSVDDDAIVAVPIVAAGSRPAPDGHVVVRVELDDGRHFEMSPGHPTADGRTLADISGGAVLGEVRVRSVEFVPYRASHTWDILPASSSGAYYAAGALVGSTLR